MGEKITIGQSLIITIFSMAVVFLVLIGISYLIDVLRVTANNNKKEAKEAKDLTESVRVSEPVEKSGNIEDEELVAVIAAAIAASMGVAIPDINIKSIKRVSTPSPIWAQMGRIEEISNKL
ncbi:sodium pump decarboxylase gamma subunit [Keratinibaculum paraultunense]|uniref:Sodium pump decarboxylase gamma subunit n=1 Tax=Keratinibaculum paraultunense TaxID=1278232 RepID=A0A4R3KTK2_9FIRM|nr:OadG family protein [Keratinibaculum paraultunense]QQY79475.1 OadG family protein [Keratinibaculum paraultunense]TCS88031.1 sodium pump decarboxylase gamma subunit [Keratinibaculum paraultunense]